MLFKESIKRFTPPKGWSWASIGDVAKLSFSSVDKKSVEGENAVRLCNYMDVFYNRRIREGMPFMVSTASESDIKKFTLNKGDVVLTKDSETPEEIAFAAVIDEQIDNLVCGYHLAVLRPDKAKVTGEYLMSAINFHPNHHQFIRLANGATRFGLGIDSLNNALLPIPPLAEQRKIAEILRTWDDAIETAQAELKAKQERKRWLTRKFFSPSLMSAGVENTKIEWPKRPLGELTEVLDGKRKPISKEFRKPGPFPYYGACGVVDYIDAHLFDEPLVLVGEDGAKWGAGESTAFIVNGKCWVNNHAHVLRPNRDVIMDYWMMSWLNFRDLSEYVSGLTVPKLNQANLRAILIPVPPLVQQRKFVEVLQASDVDIEALSNRIVSLRAQKRGLLQKLLTGEVRVAA